MMTFIKQHKTTAWLLALLAACGIAIAAADLAGNANKTCAEMLTRPALMLACKVLTPK